MFENLLKSLIASEASYVYLQAFEFSAKIQHISFSAIGGAQMHTKMRHF